MTYRARCTARKERLSRRPLHVIELWGPSGQHIVKFPEKIGRHRVRWTSITIAPAHPWSIGAPARLVPVERKSREELLAMFPEWRG